MALVTLATALTWGLVAGPAWALGADGPELTGPAALVCLIPNLIALAVISLVKTRGPVTQLGVVLGSFVFRPFVTLGLGFGVYFLIPALAGRAVALLVWGTVFYLVTLTVESLVASRQVRESTAGG